MWPRESFSLHCVGIFENSIRSQKKYLNNINEIHSIFDFTESKVAGKIISVLLNFLHDGAAIFLVWDAHLQSCITKLS